MSLPVVAITNQSTVLSDADIKGVINSLQRQVTEHFKPYYQQDCSLSFLPKEDPLPAGWWQLLIIDDPDLAGALGYHEMTVQGTPIGKVFAKLDIQAGQSWTVTASHELLEMLADPWINWIAQGSDQVLYALEVADPVEADNLGYLVDGVLVSDFITPAWFEPTQSDRFDFKRHLTKPREIAPLGYMSVFDPRNGWIQIYGSKANKNMYIPIGSRRQRRTVAVNNWRKSVR